MSSLVLMLVMFAGDVTSGPRVGDKLGDFKAVGVFGAQADKEFQLLKETQGKPTLVIFVQKITRPALQFLRPVDDYAAKEEKLSTHIVWITGDKGDKDETKAFLERAKNSLNLQTNVSICLEGKDGPPAYGLNDMAAITVLVAKEGKVVANFAYADPNSTVAREVIVATAKALGKEPPKVDEAPKSELAPLLRRMIQKDIDEAGVNRVVAALKKWAGDDAAKRKELQAACQRILRGDLGNETARAALKKLAEE
jgi:hypothetical protein